MQEVGIWPSPKFGGACICSFCSGPAPVQSWWQYWTIFCATTGWDSKTVPLTVALYTELVFCVIQQSPLPILDLMNHGTIQTSIVVGQIEQELLTSLALYWMYIKCYSFSVVHMQKQRSRVKQNYHTVKERDVIFCVSYLCSQFNI